MQLELVMYSIRRLVESKTGAKVYATYPPKDSACFGSNAGENYHNFIVYTQAIEFNSKTSGAKVRMYLYYRNKLTQGYPEFSSCEFGVFTGRNFTSLFKEHLFSKTEAEFAQMIGDKIIETIETI